MAKTIKKSEINTTPKSNKNVTYKKKAVHVSNTNETPVSKPKTVVIDNTNKIPEQHIENNPVVNTTPVVTQNTPQVQPQVENKKHKKKKKKKKHHLGLIIFLSLFSLLVVVPVGFFGIFILDYSVKANLPDGNLDVDTLRNNIVLESIKDTGKEGDTNGKIYLNSDESTLDELFAFLVNQINKKDYIPHMYCTINGDNYCFYIVAKFKFLQTKITLDTTLDSSSNNELVFKINKLKLGKFPVPNSFLDFVLNKAGLTDEKLQGMIKNAGFNVTVNLKEKYIKYTQKDFFTDIAQIVGKDNLYASIIMSLFKANDILDFNTKDKLSFTLDLKTFHQVKDEKDNDLNINYNDENNKKINFESVMKNIEAMKSDETNKSLLYDGNYLKLTETKYLFKYLLRGYDYYDTLTKKEGASEDDKNLFNFVQKLNFAKYTKPTGEKNEGTPTYKDVISDPALTSTITDLNDIVDVKITNETEATAAAKKINDGGTFNIVDIDEQKINNYYRNNSIFGYSTIIAGTKNADTDSREDIISYITLDNLNVNIIDKETVHFFVTLNVNGYYITSFSELKIEQASATSGNFPLIRFVFKNESMKMGNVKLTDVDPSLPNNLLTILANNIKCDNFSVIVTEDGAYFEFDLNNIIKTQETYQKYIKGFFDQFKDQLKFSFSTSGDTLSLLVSKKSV